VIILLSCWSTVVYVSSVPVGNYVLGFTACFYTHTYRGAIDIGAHSFEGTQFVVCLKIVCVKLVKYSSRNKYLLNYQSMTVFIGCTVTVGSFL